MFLLSELIALHSATPVVISQATLSLMFVVLAVVLIGVGFGTLSKNKESTLQHRWTMTIAVALTLTVIVFVMLPSIYNFFIDPDVQVVSQLSVFTLIHAIIGGPTIVLGVMYAFGDLPRRTRHWMRLAAVFWILSITLGILLFFDMLDLLSITPM